LQGIAILLSIISFLIFLLAGNIPLSKEIVLDIRLPEALLSFSTGAILSIGGGVFQGVFRNPLADPYILGVSAGSALGTTLAIMFGIPQEPVALLFSLSTVGLIVAAGYCLRSNVKLLLFGVILNAFLSALILFIYATMPSESLQSAIFFTLGFISPVSITSSLVVFASSILMVILFTPISERLNAISMGDIISYFSGVSPSVERIIYIAIVSTITSIAVSKTGIIGFVGIVVPNMLRLLNIRSFKQIIPLSFYVGGIFLLVSQFIAKTIISPIQLPVGVITAILGSPVFTFILWRYTSIVKN